MWCKVYWNHLNWKNDFYQQTVESRTNSNMRKIIVLLNEDLLYRIALAFVSLSGTYFQKGQVKDAGMKY